MPDKFSTDTVDSKIILIYANLGVNLTPVMTVIIRLPHKTIDRRVVRSCNELRY